MTVTQLSPTRRHPAWRRTPELAIEPAEVVAPTTRDEVRALRHIDLRSATRVAIAFAVTSCVVWVTAVALFTLGAAATGLTTRVENLARSVGFRGFQVMSTPVFLTLAVLGVLWIIGIVVLAVVAVACFNVANRTTGPVRAHMESSVDDQEGRGAPADTIYPTAR
jgi:hypothetical protein